MTELDQTPVLLTKVDIRQAGLRNKMLLGDVDGDGRMELVMVQPDGGIDDRYVPHQVQCVTAYNLDGRLLWQVGEPDEQAGGPDQTTRHNCMTSTETACWKCFV